MYASLEIYESLPSVFKIFVLDERDAIQKKAFTNWVNQHLVKVIIVIGCSSQLSLTTTLLLIYSRAFSLFSLLSFIDILNRSRFSNGDKWC